MACTQLVTPSVGVSDWTNFITQVEYQRRGFMAVSYTNFSGTAASAIAAGSIIEVAGSIYQFTATNIDYTGGPSAASDLYIYVKPDAVISTATVVAWGSAPVWVDAKQGFYASAASTIRAIGGMYVGTAATYYNKYIYTGELLNYCLETGETRPLLRKIFDIGEWNMDATATIDIYTYIPNTKIREIEALITADSGSSQYSLEVNAGVATSAIGGYWITNDVSPGIQQVRLLRIAGGIFDNVNYDGTVSTVANRGTLAVIFEA